MPPRKTPKNTSKARRKKSIMRLPSSLKQLTIIYYFVFSICCCVNGFNVFM